MEKKDNPPKRRDFEIRSLTERDGEASKDALLKKEISDFSTMKPEVVAQLIKNWINGDN